MLDIQHCVILRCTAQTYLYIYHEIISEHPLFHIDKTLKKQKFVSLVMKTLRIYSLNNELLYET